MKQRWPLACDPLGVLIQTSHECLFPPDRHFMGGLSLPTLRNNKCVRGDIKETTTHESAHRQQRKHVIFVSESRANHPTEEEDRRAKTISPDITGEIGDEGLPASTNESGDRPPLPHPPKNLLSLCGEHGLLCQCPAYHLSPGARDNYHLALLQHR